MHISGTNTYNKLATWRGIMLVCAVAGLGACQKNVSDSAGISSTGGGTTGGPTTPLGVDYPWSVKATSGASFDAIASAAGSLVDSQGNSFFAISFDSPNFSISGANFSRLGSQEFALLKLDRHGQLLWARHFEASGYSNFQSMKLDASQNIVLNGYFDGNRLSIEDESHEVLTHVAGVAGTSRQFLTTFSSDGNLQQLWNFDSPSGAIIVNGFKFDSTGSIVVGGSASANITIRDKNSAPIFVSTHITTSYDSFLFKLSPNGTMVTLAKVLSGNGLSFMYSFDVDKSDNIYIGASYDTNPIALYDEIATATPPVTYSAPLGGQDHVIAKFLSNGTLVWSESINASELTSLTVQSNGDGVFAFITWGGAALKLKTPGGAVLKNFDNAQVPWVDSNDSLVMKLDASDGSLLFSVATKSVGQEYLQNFVALDDGSFYLGSTYTNADFKWVDSAGGMKSMPYNAGEDFTLAKFSPTGVLSFADSFTDSGDINQLYDFIVNPADGSQIMEIYANNVAFTDNLGVTTNFTGGFVAKISASGILQFGFNNAGGSFFVRDNGNLWWLSNYSAATAITNQAGAPAFTLPPSHGSTDVFLAEVNGTTGNVTHVRTANGAGIESVYSFPVDAFATPVVCLRTTSSTVIGFDGTPLATNPAGTLLILSPGPSP